MVQFLGRVILQTLLPVSMVILFSGCVPTEMLPFNRKPVETTTVTVNGAHIIIGGPSGFCVNNRQIRTPDAGAFVVLGPCIPKEASSAGTAGLLVANVSPNTSSGNTTDASALESFFKTKAGRKSLSNSGTADSVDILSTVSANGVFFIHTRDSSDPLIPDTTSEKWRGFFLVSEHMVSISMVNFTDAPISQSVVFKKLKGFSMRILELNRNKL